jgi:transglutaminase-like putative cysteine protease
MSTKKCLYKGIKVTTWEGLKPYIGKEACEVIVGSDRQKAYLLNYEQLQINYGESVDFQLRKEQAILCPQTVDFLYSKFTSTTVTYQKGSHPFLEEVVDGITSNCKNNREKALRLMRFCRDLYKKDITKDFSLYIYGGTEEELVEKPEELCECLGRLMVALCEIAGIPGRNSWNTRSNRYARYRWTYYLRDIYRREMGIYRPPLWNLLSQT